MKGWNSSWTREEDRGRAEEEREEGGRQEEAEESEGENGGEKDGERGSGGEEGKREDRQLAPARSMEERRLLRVSGGKE